MSATAQPAHTVHVHRVEIKATPEAIWEAITTPEWTQRYGYRSPAIYDLRPGGKYQALASEEMKARGAPDVAVVGEVIEVDPPRRLVQTWHPVWDAETAAEPVTRLTYEIEAGEAGVSVLTVIHDVTGADGVGALVAGQVPNAGGGWNDVLSDLKALLETGKPLVCAAPRSRVVDRALLGCGVAAGPVFLAVVAVQALTRDGFELSRHPISLLSLGPLGWIQIANFIVAGLLSCAFAVGLRRAIRTGAGRTWAAPPIGVYGLGLIAGGIFITDPAFGYPAGAPSGIQQNLSWHGTLHAIAPPVAFTALVIACFVFARRFALLRQWGWVTYSAATAVTALVLAAWPGTDGLGPRLAVAVTLAFAWTTAVAARLIRERSPLTPSPRGSE